MRLSIMVAAAMLALAACEQGGEQTAATDAAPAAPAAAPAPAPAPAAPAAPSAADLERERLAKMAAVYADEAAFSVDCVAEGAIDKSVCDCVAKETVKTIGAKGLYRWVWEGYVKREGTAQMRSRKWFTDNAVDTAGQKKFADAVGTCYVTQ